MSVSSLAESGPIKINKIGVITGVIIASVIIVFLVPEGFEKPALFVIGIGLGVSLYHASFGFVGAYRRLFQDKDMGGITAQLIMLAAAIILFAPILAQGNAFGHGVGGAIAPVSVQAALGAFLFGIGMQYGGACASGTLFSLGGGNLRMLLVLIFFCLGAFWGSLDLSWWGRLPSLGSISIADKLGWELALPLQLSVLLLIYLVLRLSGCQIKGNFWPQPPFRWATLIQGPWPMIWGAGGLVGFNWLTLLIAGHPWSITWGYTLWGAKIAAFTGWDSASSGFWDSGFQASALSGSILSDTTSLMNIGIILGAFIAAALRNPNNTALKKQPKARFNSIKPIVTAIIGGLIMGYGARLAYGCNVGAFFSGVASGSLHGWVWISCAIPGVWVGLQLRRVF